MIGALMMLEAGELTYWEYWLSKKVWPARLAVQLITDYIKWTRGWFPTDDSPEVNRSIHIAIERQMNDEALKDIFLKRTVSIDGYDEDGEWIEGALNLDASDVVPKKFIEWIYAKGYPVPYELKAFIGVVEKGPALSVKAEERLDRLVCQGIAKALWDIYPKMTIDDMQFHKAIQLYGGGKGYRGEGTLRRWLREVDPREIKTGPKPKV
jgi:hypothetical protein